MKLFRKKRPSAASQTAAEPVLLDAEMLRCRFPDALPWQLEIIESVQSQTMTSPERILALIEAVAHICQHQIEGDFVECGVWRGGSSAAIARTLMHFGQTDRQLWMYDTFEGMVPPTDSDVDLLGQTAQSLLDEQDVEQATSVWCRSPLEEVRETMTETGFPVDHIALIQGKVEDTLPQRRPDQIALLRLDTDWYESTKCELEYLYPSVVGGGVLIIDDYGHWQGCRKAVDEYFANEQIAMLLNRIDYTGRIGIVPAARGCHV